LPAPAVPPALEPLAPPALEPPLPPDLLLLLHPASMSANIPITALALIKSNCRFVLRLTIVWPCFHRAMTLPSF
jgi:hypothetical protein